MYIGGHFVFCQANHISSRLILVEFGLQLWDNHRKVLKYKFAFYLKCLGSAVFVSIFTGL